MAFDLFPSLEKIASRDMEWYDKLSDEDKKSAAPFVIMRWLTGTKDSAQIVRINTFVNPYAFSLGQEKALLFKLLAASSTGKTRRFQWIKAPGKTASKLKTEAIKEYYNVSTREAALYVMNTSDDDAINMAEELGWEKEEVAKLKKEVSNGNGSTEKAGVIKKKRN
jgi:hypothetical protein